MPSRAELRTEQTRAGCARLRSELGDWAGHRLHRDANGQYRTQLTSIHNTFDAALQIICAFSDGLAVLSAGDVFDQCRDIDRQIVLVRRLWWWYAEKFDQRDDREFQRVLAAADEVVWSVHAQIFRSVETEPLPPAPLPYIDAVTAPEAVLRDEPPSDLRPDQFDSQLRATLARLPVPVVALPEVSRTEPWTLVLLGHEVGHHLQYDLQPRFGLVASVGAELARVTGSGRRDNRWRAWSRELFADLAGLVTMGPASVAALLPYELGSDDWLVSDERGSYPPPALRIATIAAMAQRLGLDCSRELDDCDPAGWLAARADDAVAEKRSWARTEFDLVPAVATALVDAVVAQGSTLADLAGFRRELFAPHGRVARRAEGLRADGGMVEQGLETVRELASAGMAAWQQVALADGPPREQAMSDLSATLIDRLIDSREPGTRATQSAASVEADEVLVAMLSRVRDR